MLATGAKGELESIDQTTAMLCSSGSKALTLVSLVLLVRWLLADARALESKASLPETLPHAESKMKMKESCGATSGMALLDKFKN